MPDLGRLAAWVWVATATASVGCGDEAALRAERDRLEGELLLRQVVLADLATLRDGAEALDLRIQAMRQQLETPNVRLLAAGLVEEEATGYLEEREGAPSRVVLKGPGPAERALSALEQAAQRAPGLRVKTLTLTPERWEVACEVDEPLPVAAAPLAPPSVAAPPWPFHQALWGEVERLRAEVGDADARIGVDLSGLERKRWEAVLLERRLEEPDRLGRLSSWMTPLFGGDAPVVAAVQAAVDGASLSGEGHLGPGQSLDGLKGRLGAGADVEALADGRVRFRGRVSD